MAPPKPVDISALENLDLEIFVRGFQKGDVELGKGEVLNHLADQTAGSDLHFDAENLTFYQFVGEEGNIRKDKDVYKEAAQIKFYKSLDGDGNQEISLEEMRAGLIRDLDESEGQRAAAWLKNLEYLMEKRYRPIANNLRTLPADPSWMNTHRLLNTYHQGLYLEDSRQAQSFFNPDHAPKWVANMGAALLRGVWALRSGAIWAIPGQWADPLKETPLLAKAWNFILPESWNVAGKIRMDQDFTISHSMTVYARVPVEGEAEIMEGSPQEIQYKMVPTVSVTADPIKANLIDAALWAKAYEDKNERELALHRLYRTMVDASQEGRDWYLNKDIHGALDDLARKHPESAEILRKELPVVELHEALNQEDKVKGFTQLLEFANAERPYLAGGSGGNTKKGLFWGKDGLTLDLSNWHRLLGLRYNWYFAMSVFDLFQRERLTGSEQDEALRNQATYYKTDMLGTGGSFSNLFSVATTGGSHEASTWSDSEVVEGYGALVNLGFWIFNGSRALRGLGDIAGLQNKASARGLLGMLGVGQTWLKQARPWSPLRGMGTAKTRRAVADWNAATEGWKGVFKLPSTGIQGTFAWLGKKIFGLEKDLMHARIARGAELKKIDKAIGALVGYSWTQWGMEGTALEGLAPPMHDISQADHDLSLVPSYDPSQADSFIQDIQGEELQEE